MTCRRCASTAPPRLYIDPYGDVAETKESLMIDDPFLAVAADLRAIRDMHDALPDQAAHKATARLMPGGLAMVALGPVASPEAAGYVVETIEVRRVEWLAEVGDNDDDWEPPLQTLLFWSEAWRVEHGCERDRVTLNTEATFLHEVLSWAYDNEPHWEDFTKDVRSARRRLEDLLYDGEREERSRVPCIDCTVDSKGETISIRLVRRFGVMGRDDHWICPKCRRKYDAAAFLRARHDHMNSEGAERFIPLADAVACIPKPESTVRSWLFRAHVEQSTTTGKIRLVQRGKVRWICDLRTRQVMCWWPDMRDKAGQLSNYTHVSYPVRESVGTSVSGPPKQDGPASAATLRGQAD